MHSETRIDELLFPGFQESLPDLKGLSNIFGFRIPETFASVIKALYKYGSGDSKKCNACFAEATGFYFAGEDSRYPQTPPELFPIGTMGVDGVHLGYVVHAPDLEASEYPIGEICPMDSDGVIFVGGDTREALENLMSFEISYKPKESECIRLVSDALGMRPRAEKAKRRYGIDGRGLRIEPAVPQGWKYVPSSDGIGVLAPQDTFTPGEIRILDLDESADMYLHEARRALDREFPATALYYLREGYWRFWTDKGKNTTLSVPMIEAYHALGRPTLAKIVKRRAELFRE
jgi:hypothetical protein